MTVETRPARVDRPQINTQLSQRLSLVTAVLIAFAIIFPRSATTVFLIPVVAALSVLARDRNQARLRLPVSKLLIAATGFALFAMLSAAWSAAPAASLSKPLFLMGGAIGISVMLALSRNVPDAVLNKLAQGVLLGAALGAAFVVLETVTNQAVSRFMMTIIPWFRVGYDKHVTVANGMVVLIGDANIKRRATMVTLLILPAALLVLALAKPTLQRIGAAAILAVCVVFLTASTHQSSQVAIIVAALVFALAHYSPLWTRRIMTVIWCSACLLVIPIVVALHQTDLHKKSSLGFTSARHRIVIWNTTAAKVWKSPILGIGADATATLTEVEAKQNLAETGNLPRDGQFEASAARHAHNVFLQVWYELGAVGALLFMAVGLAVLALIARVNATAQPALLAHFAAVVGLMSFSYSVWQLWFQGAIGLGIMAMTLAVIMIDRKAHPLNQA